MRHVGRRDIGISYEVFPMSIIPRFGFNVIYFGDVTAFFRPDGPSAINRHYKRWISPQGYHRTDGRFSVFKKPEDKFDPNLYLLRDYRINGKELGVMRVSEWFTKNGVDPCDMSEVDELIFIDTFS